MPSTGQLTAAMISSSGRGYLLLTTHSRGWAAPYQTSAAEIGCDAATTSGSRPVWQMPMIASRDRSTCGIAFNAPMVRSERNQSIRVADVAAGVAAMERVLVRMPEVEIRRDGDEAVARETLRQVACVAHQAVALVHDDHGGSLCRIIRHGDEGRHAAAAVNGPRSARPALLRCFREEACVDVARRAAAARRDRPRRRVRRSSP